MGRKWWLGMVGANLTIRVLLQIKALTITELTQIYGALINDLPGNDFCIFSSFAIK